MVEAGDTRREQDQITAAAGYIQQGRPRNDRARWQEDERGQQGCATSTRGSCSQGPGRQRAHAKQRVNKCAS